MNGLTLLAETVPPDLLGFFEPVALDNRGSVLRISSQGYEGAHFATFPEALIEPMVKAGTSERGCCADCGTPWRRVTEERPLRRERPNEYVKRTGEDGTGNSCGNGVAGVEVKTVGWEPGCECRGRFVREKGMKNRAGAISAPGWAGSSKVRPISSAGELSEYVSSEVDRYVSDISLEDHPTVPCTVLDPFVGSGTTCCVALALGRRGWGIDLSEVYLRDNAVPRVEGKLLSTGRGHLVPGKGGKPVTLGGRNLLAGGGG